jgi:hypothetical protein
MDKNYSFGKVILILVVTYFILAGMFCYVYGADNLNTGNDKLSSLGHLTQWVGKSPYDEINGKTMIEDKAFSKSLLKVLGEKWIKILLSDLTNSDVTEREGQILAITVWKPHMAGDHADIFVNLKDNSVEVYWIIMSIDKDGDEFYWLSSKMAPRRLTKNDCWFGAYNRFDIFRQA